MVVHHDNQEKVEGRTGEKNPYSLGNGISQSSPFSINCRDSTGWGISRPPPGAPPAAFTLVDVWLSILGC